MVIACKVQKKHQTDPNSGQVVSQHGPQGVNTSPEHGPAVQNGPQRLDIASTRAQRMLNIAPKPNKELNIWQKEPHEV